MTTQEKTELRISRLENDREDLYEISTRIEGKVDSLEAEFREFKAEMTSFKAEMTSFKAEMLDFRSRTEAALAEILRRLPDPS